MKINLCVLFGGRSVEHEISVISALQAMENLNAEKYEIIPHHLTVSSCSIWTTEYCQLQNCPVKE